MKDKEIKLNDFIVSNSRIAEGLYDQVLPYIERMFIEVDSAPSYVETFVTFLPGKMRGEFGILISIPAWKYCFVSPPLNYHFNNWIVNTKLDSFYKVSQFILDRAYVA
ncbi:hypothetical protein ACN6MY_07895 [Peribacillus sp. B-H-3]|uniref:hypothetical protein n=1 Tax=Peribacillus sp. B-H-3 TaxID=3400420 RepID=UPI003B022FE3